MIVIIIVIIIAIIKSAQVGIEIIEYVFPKNKNLPKPNMSRDHAIKRPHILQKMSHTEHISCQVW